MGSESLIELVGVCELPGTSWLVDLPGDGSNVNAPGAPADPYTLWPHVLLEAVAAVPDPVVIGHSRGGEYLLSVPSLEQRIAALVLISSAPDSGWIATFDAMARAEPLPGYAAAAERYEADPNAGTLRALAEASAPWDFGRDGITAGQALLARIPYNHDAAEWSAEHFNVKYVARWWPRSLPTLVVSGEADRIVDRLFGMTPPTPETTSSAS